MAKKRKIAKKKQKTVKKPVVLEVRAEAETMRGRYANLIHVSLQDEDFVLDFLAKVGEQATLVSRVFITPQHGQRLLDLLRLHVARHKREKAKKR